ncbi:MAG: mannose-1-phosphate guanylyltransferase [Myxococcales bacterium]|nr:mannose-1-phosphate guanylyltransferase [Myxococcales bacterium]
MHRAHVFISVLAGGSGTRFWPASRKGWPKQFLPLGKDPHTPLIAATLARVAPLAPPERTMVVTGRALAEATRSMVPSSVAAKVLAEPVAKNTAPAVAWATRAALREDPDAIVVVLPADAYIEDEEAFREALARAIDAANRGAIVTLGIRPTRPETGYGYLHVGKPTEHAGVFEVVAFVEKPDLARAQQYLRDGRHLWNAGIFVFRASVMDAAVREHLPQVWAGMNEVDADVRDGAREEDAIERVFQGFPSVSIDYGVMEKVARVDVVPTDCGWSDVGSWQASWELGDKDANNNVVRAEDPTLVVLEDASGTVISAPKGKIVAVIGVDDLVIVDTPDALLVAPRSRAQDVKRAVDVLAQRGKKDVL